MTKILLKPADSAQSLLTAGISAVALSIPITAASGALFPQPYNGSCTSTGSATALNSTGISAAIGGSGAVGKFIYNATDGSWAKIVSVATNSLVTTRLNDGTLNVWTNADKWYIDPFIATLAVVSTSAYGVKTVTASEKVLIIGRATDTLTVATGGRGYDGSTAQSFSLGDSFYLNVNQATIANIQEVILSVQTMVDTNLTTLNTTISRVAAIEDGTFFYVVATGSANAFVVSTPAFAAYTAGNRLTFKANFSITGATTINVNGLGAKSIKKGDGATALATGNIANGQIVEIEYDGTNFQMLSPIANPAAGATITRYQVTDATDLTTTSATYTDIGSLTQDVVCTGSTILMLSLTGDMYNTSATADTYMNFSVGGSLVIATSLWFVDLNNFGANMGFPVNMTVTVVPSAGTITCKPQWKTSAGTQHLLGTAQLTVFTIIKIEP